MMFSNLDNFLKGQTKFNEAQNDLPDTTFSNANDSWDLDMSIPTAAEANSKANNHDDSEKGASFVPRKGQKLAAKRLKKIGDTLANKLVQAQIVQNQVERKASKAKKKSPTKKPKANNSRRGHGRGAHIIHDSSSSLSSETDEQWERPSTRPAYDPNTIVLDGDDEFIGGPAMNFTRNLATARAISVEDSMCLKVNVRINGKIESFQMSPFQKLSMIVSQISDKQNISSDHVTLMFKDRTISEHETPNSIGYIQGLVIKAHISDMVNETNNTAETLANANVDKLEIKIQADGRKRPFITYIRPTDKLITLAFSCAEEFKCDVGKVLIEFDGEFINFKETPEDLALEGGEVMDFFMKKS